ncbi:MAG: hypothetical protein ACNS60_04200, partial [Candidatus Cyclobacteriaceae bacterium M2_1C_046]
MLESFDADPEGELPRGWYDRDGTKKLKDHSKKFVKGYKYKVLEQNGDKFLRYEGTQAKHINLPLVNEEKENIYDINIYD